MKSNQSAPHGLTTHTTGRSPAARRLPGPTAHRPALREHPAVRLHRQGQSARLRARPSGAVAGRQAQPARLYRAHRQCHIVREPIPRLRFSSQPQGPYCEKEGALLTIDAQINSTFTPVPKRVLDGSEETEILPAAITSGAPMELQARTVRIYKQAKPATQSGDWQSKKWRMDWDVLPKGHRWENPLMGWQSSADYMQGTHLSFKSKEDAVHFAEKQGYEYFVQEPNERKFTPKAYANNFLYSPGKLKHIRTK